MADTHITIPMARLIELETAEHERDILRTDNAKLAREAHTWSKAAESYAADAERFRWLAERHANGQATDEELAAARAAAWAAEEDAARAAEGDAAWAAARGAQAAEFRRVFYGEEA